MTAMAGPSWAFTTEGADPTHMAVTKSHPAFLVDSSIRLALARNTALRIPTARSLFAAPLRHLILLQDRTDTQMGALLHEVT